MRLQPDGYKILLEVVARGNWISIANVPYTFAKRHTGDSKADLHEGLVFLRHLANYAVATKHEPEVAEAANHTFSGLALLTVPGS